jgi:SAM-dependent methyltransferase
VIESVPAAFAERLESKNATVLEIGGGSANVEKGWMNIDPVHGQGHFKRPAQDVPWPLADSSVDLILAAHVMEHIPAGQPRIDVMNEAHRVLKPDGLFCIIVPLLCNENIGLTFFTAIADPTHVSFWVMSSFAYFDGTMKANAEYGIKQWKTSSFDTERFTWEGRWLASPVKDF